MNGKDLEDCNQTYINPCPSETNSNQATADRLSGVENRLKTVENQLSLVRYRNYLRLEGTDRATLLTTRSTTQKYKLYEFLRYFIYYKTEIQSIQTRKTKLRSTKLPILP